MTRKLSIMERAALERQSPRTTNVGTYSPNVSQHYRDSNVKELESAKNYADLSRQWAIKMTGKVQDEDFSSKYYANESKKFATSIGDLASQVSKDAEQVAKDAAQVSQDASQVAIDANQVSQDANQVSQDANQVAVDADQVAKDKVEVENNANQVAKDAAQVSDDAKFVHDFTVGPNPPSQLDTPSDTNNAYYYFQQVLNLTSGSISFNNKFTPTASKEYPDKTPTSGLWMIETTDLDNGYTFTTGNMKGFTCYTGDWFAYYKTPDVFEVLAVSPIHHQGLPSASEDKAGIAEIATQEEVDKGLDDSRFVTPLKLSKKEWKGLAQSEANMKAQRTLASNEFAASGFVHYGQGYSNNVNSHIVNEGLWSNETFSNVLRLGRGNVTTGSSKTTFPVTHIAGFISKIFGVNQVDESIINSIKFPEAPNGAVVYDSTGNCRGSGKATLDLTKDVDPKYGDVAADVNEAVGRAFEGQVKNGDFRLGTESWKATYSGNTFAVTDSVATLSSGNSRYTGIEQRVSKHVTGLKYNFELTVREASTDAILVMSFNNEVSGQVTVRASELPKTYRIGGILATASAGNCRFYFDSGDTTAETFKVSGFSWKPESEEVVINRVDMFGFEYFLEEVTETNPFVYPYGMIQSKITTMEGETTYFDNRPKTYSAVFEGDESSQGKGVNFWFADSDVRTKLVSNPDHNIYLLDDGRLVQWRCRQRTIAGAGNGKWRNTSPTTNQELQYLNNTGSIVTYQGQQDTISSQDWNNAFEGVANVGNVKPNTGVFTVHKNAGITPAVDGECYFLVCGVVPRLNQGAYHPSFNPMGSATVLETTGRDWSRKWYAVDAVPLKNTVDCFDFTGANRTPYPYLVGKVVGSTASSSTLSGSLAAGANFCGRPDGKFYDVIYAYGQGGVIDYRLSAWDMSSKEEASKIFQKVVNGSYRGEESLMWTSLGEGHSFIKTGTASWDSTQNGRFRFAVQAGGDWLSGTGAVANGFLGTGDVRVYKTYLVGSNGNVWEVLGLAQAGKYGDIYRSGDIIYAGLGDSTQINTFNDMFPTGTEIRLVQTRYTPSLYSSAHSPISGNFAQEEVIGSPENILTIPALANGWLGSWNPKFHTNYNAIVGTRKNVLGVVARRYTDDLGTTWGSDSPQWDSIKNTFVASSLQPTGRVEIWEYTAFAKQTKSSTNKKVLSDSCGLGNVFASAHSNASVASLFTESLFGKVCTSSVDAAYNYYHLTKPTLTEDGDLVSYSGYIPSHTPIDLAAPNNSSPAVKALWYQTSNNQQCSLNFAWNELKWEDPVFVTHNGSSDEIPPYANVRFIAGLWSGHLWKRYLSTSVSAPIDHYFEQDDGNIYHIDSLGTGIPSFKKWNRAVGAWGDDSTIRIVDKTSTYVNLNGETCLYGTSELSIPYGFSKNMARAGAQVLGVDLKTDLKGDLHVN